VSSKVANKLMKAESAEAFLRSQRGVVEWPMLAALKTEVDRLRGRDLNAAANLASRITELAKLIDHPVSQAFAEASRAYVLHQQGNYQEANPLFDSAVAIMRRANLATEAAIIQKTQVDVLVYLGRFKDALRTARVARRSLAKAGMIQIAQLETNVGNIYYQLDNYKKALNHYNLAHEIFSLMGDDSMRAVVDFGRANIFTELDQPEEALVLLEGAAAIFKKSGQAFSMAQTLFHIAYIQFLRGNTNTALTNYYQAREKLISLGSFQLAAWCDLEIAEILLALNAFEDAHESATNARARFSEFGMKYESAKASLTCALAATGLQNFDEAHKHLLEARQVFAKDNNKIFTALADTYLAELAIHRTDYPEARQRAEAASRVFVRQKLSTRSAYSRLLLSKAAYLSGNFTKAERLVKAVLKEVENLFAPAIVYKSHHLLGQIQRQRKRPALEHFRSAVAVIEKMRASIAADEFKTTFLRDKVETYEDAIKACLDEGSEPFVEEAFRLVESSKSRALADLLARFVSQSNEQTPRGLSLETRQRLARLIQDLHWYSSHAGLEEDKGDQRRGEVAQRYRREVMRCEKQIAQLFRRSEVESSAFAELQNAHATAGRDLCAGLEADECALEYFITGDEISAFVASPNEIKIVRNIASKIEVEKVLTAFRFQIEKFNYGQAFVNSYFGQLKRTTDGHLMQLHKLIFAPLEALLSPEKLIIIPHGLLHYVPFHALRAGENYLLDRYEISYAPSASVLKLCRAKSQAQKTEDKTASGKRQATIKLVALGVAEAGTPSIEDEILALQAIFPDSVRLTGDQATHKNLQRFAPQARFLHLASHGYFRRDNPMFSFLKLADSNLHFYNLLDLELQAEMVTLSACHTGVNAIFPGDELYGLMRGFLYAGTPSMVVSLWAVNDRSTTELMREMYANIKAGETKRGALRKAQLLIKEAYGHPYYWAPFVLMGDTTAANIF
jgi:CHAT domain-containing protein